MNLHLLRHGIAEDQSAVIGGGRDAARALTEEGRTKLRRIVRAWEALGLEFDLVFSSPYVRARQTAEIVLERLAGRAKLRFSEHLVPGGDGRALVEELGKVRPAPENVLLVGHEPQLSTLASLLLSGGPGCSLTLKKGGLCRLAVERLEAGRCASLEWWLTPKQMSLMAE